MSTGVLTLDTDTAILEAHRAGDTERAATAFVRRHQKFVYSVALRNLHHHEENAKDATQEVLVRALRGLESFKGESTLQTWLYRITVNVCNNMRRKQRLLSFFSVGDDDHERDVVAIDSLSPADVVAQQDFLRYLDRVLDSLPRKQRETFCLRYFDELSYEEISEMVGTSVGALKANYHWAVKKIAEQLRTSDFYAAWMESTS